MRANYALENTVQPLKDSIQNALDEKLSELAQEVGIHKNDIYQIAVVGNTCMHHLFPRTISPFVPMSTIRLI